MCKLPEDKCTGCGTCVASCPFKAISMKEDNEGFLYPYIDPSKCKKCGLCEKRCPMLNVKKYRKNDFSIYAAYTKNKEILFNSSSGGIFYELASNIISLGGIVYGVTYDKIKGAYHIPVNKIENLKNIMGSKYLQANASLVFPKIKEELTQGKTILFSGSPCQVAGLKEYLDKDYENLITIDFICTGVPSSKVFKEYIRYWEKKYNDTFKTIDYRNKQDSWYNFKIKMEFEHKTRYESRFLSPLMLLHFKCLSLRKSCYNCNFRKGNSPSDIELGDFWNVDLVNKEIYNKNGVSCVIIKSDKGAKLFNKILNNIKLTQVSEENLLKVNKSYDNFYMDKEKRDKFFNEFRNSTDRINIIKKYTNYSFKQRFRIKKNLLVLKLKNK